MPNLTKSSLSYATTLVHKSALPMAIHAIRTFAECHHETYRLEIHTDGSPDENDHQLLMQAAGAMAAVVVTPAARQPMLAGKLAGYPKTASLLEKGGYFTKLELPMVVTKPYFYFDSDIVWLRPAANLAPPASPNAFSTESWSWYFGIRHPELWLKERVPRRVNSGFYHLGGEFPFARMESLLERDMFDPIIVGNSDQEIMAYLFKDMSLYHPEDLKRSRVGVLYDLDKTTACALHFPGRMWLKHMDQIERYTPDRSRPAMNLRFNPAPPLSVAEISRMRFYRMLADLRLLNTPIRWYRNIRRQLTSTKR